MATWTDLRSFIRSLTQREWGIVQKSLFIHETDPDPHFQYLQPDYGGLRFTAPSGVLIADGSKIINWPSEIPSTANVVPNAGLGNIGVLETGTYLIGVCLVVELTENRLFELTIDTGSETKVLAKEEPPSGGIGTIAAVGIFTDPASVSLFMDSDNSARTFEVLGGQFWVGRIG